MLAALLLLVCLWWIRGRTTQLQDSIRRWRAGILHQLMLNKHKVLGMSDDSTMQKHLRQHEPLQQ